MIKELLIKVKTRVLGGSIKKHLSVISQWNISGTWIAVSPVEKLPEVYNKYLISKEDTLRTLYDIPEDWNIYKISNKDNDFNLIDKIKNEVYSIRALNTVKEIDYDYPYFWAVISPDLNYPKSYNPEILKENPWIEKGGWSLFCIGRAWNEEEREKARKEFKKSLPPDVIYEETI